MRADDNDRGRSYYQERRSFNRDGTRTTMVTEEIPGLTEVEVGAMRATDEITTRRTITSLNPDRQEMKTHM